MNALELYGCVQRLTALGVPAHPRLWYVESNKAYPARWLYLRETVDDADAEAMHVAWYKAELRKRYRNVDIAETVVGGCPPATFITFSTDAAVPTEVGGENTMLAIESAFEEIKNAKNT